MQLSKLKSYHITPIFCLVIYILVFAASYIKTGGELTVNSFLALFVMEILVFVIPSFIYKRIQGPIEYKKLGIRPVGASSVILSVCAAIFMFCAAVLTSLRSPSTDIYHADLSEIGVMNVIYIVVIYCLLPAAVEEIAFRSVIYGEYRRHGIFGAVLLSSVLFALLHFSLSSFITYFICGVVLALVYEVTRSVFASMTVHFLYNLLSVFTSKMLSDAANKSDNMIPFVFIFVIVMLLFLFFALSRAQKLLEHDAERLPESENEEFPPLHMRLRSLLISVVSPGFILCLGFAFFAGIMKIRQ